MKLKKIKTFVVGNPPTKPGLGIELNESVAIKNTYDGSKLHLEMAEI